MQNEYVFFGGNRIARRDVPTGHKHYYFSNHVGSASVITSDLGIIQEESDYYPYGGETPITNGDPNIYKFTGKERDTESGLDNFAFRYYSSALGRFMKPDDDSGQRWENPQTLNLYDYVRNNPLTNIDPDGHDCVYLNNAGDHVESVDQQSNEGECGGNGGYWVNGGVTDVQINPSMDTVELTGTMNGQDVTKAYYQGPESPRDMEIMADIVPGGRSMLAFNNWAGRAMPIVDAYTFVLLMKAGGSEEGAAEAGVGSTAETLMATRPAWAANPGGFVNWLKNLQKAGAKLSTEQADAVVAEAKTMGVQVRLDPPHPGTNWNVPHLNIGNEGQVHLEVPQGYTNPSVPQGHQ